jgi:hypothetical protein
MKFDIRVDFENLSKLLQVSSKSQTKNGYFTWRPLYIRGPGIWVGLATSYGLDGPEIESRWGEIFRTCPDRPWGAPTSCTMGPGSFPGVKSGRGVTLTPHPLLELYLYSLYGPYGLYRASVPVQWCTLLLKPDEVNESQCYMTVSGPWASFSRFIKSCSSLINWRVPPIIQPFSFAFHVTARAHSVRGITDILVNIALWLSDM